MTHELYKTARPITFDAMLGSGAYAAGLMQDMIARDKYPHASLFIGPSGCGKTTLARIARVALGCEDLDATELNCASFNGIDMVRALQRQMHQRPLTSPCRVWIIDEAHQLTTPAQNAMLKSLEDTPEHVYIMLCTTTPAKLIKAIKTRCTSFIVKEYSTSELSEIIRAAVDGLDTETVDAIAGSVEGSARQALVLADAVLASSENPLDVVTNYQETGAAIDFARLLFKRPSWQTARQAIKEITDPPETTRHVVLGYAAAILGSADGTRAEHAYNVIREFENNFYDSGKAGLLAAAYALLGPPE